MRIHASMDVVLGVRIVLCCPLVSTFTFLAFISYPVLIVVML